MRTFDKQDGHNTPPQAGADAQHADAIRRRIAEARERIRRAHEQNSACPSAAAGSRHGAGMQDKATSEATAPSAVPHRPGRSATADGGRDASPPPRTSVTSANLRGPRRPGRRVQPPSIFFRALCVSTALHVGVFGGGAWMALTHPSGFGAAYGSILKASLVSPDDAWARETVPPPIDVASIERWPASSGSAKTKATRPRGRYARKSGASGVAENVKHFVSTGNSGRHPGPSGGSPTDVAQTLSPKSPTSEALPVAVGLEAGQVNPASGVSAPPAFGEDIAAALPTLSAEPPSPSSLSSNSSVAGVQEGVELTPPAVETTPRQGKAEPVEATDLKSFPAVTPAPAAASPKPPVLPQPVESPGLSSKPIAPVVIASVPRTTGSPVTAAKISPEKPGIRLAEEQRVETAEVPRRTGAGATGEGTAGGKGGKGAGERSEKTEGQQGGRGAGGQRDKTAKEQTGRRAEAPVPVVPPVANSLGQEVGRGSAPSLSPKPLEDVQVAKATTEPSGVVQGRSPLFQPDPAPPVPMETRPFARQPDPEGTIPPGPFQTARTSSVPPPEEPSASPKPMEPPRLASGPPGLLETAAMPGSSDTLAAPAKVEPPRPTMPPFEERSGRSAEAQRAEAAGEQGTRGAGENKNKPAEAQGRRGAGEKESKSAETQGRTGARAQREKGGGDEQVTELKPAPAIPPVAEQAKTEVSRPPLPRLAPKISEETPAPATVAETKRAVPESAPVVQPEPVPPKPAAEVPAKEPAPAPPVPQVPSPPTPSTEKSGATPAQAAENLPPAGPTRPAAASAPPAPSTAEPKSSLAALQPQLAARTGAEAEQVVGAERGRGSQEAGMQGGRGADVKSPAGREGGAVEGQERGGEQAKSAAPTQGRGSTGGAAQGKGGTVAEGVVERQVQRLARAPDGTADGGQGAAASGQQVGGSRQQAAGEGDTGKPGVSPDPGVSGSPDRDTRRAESPDRTAAPVAVMEKPVQASPPPVVGLPGFSVQIHRPQGGTTSQAIQPLAGRVSGGVVKGIVVHLNGRQQLLDAWENAFEGEVILRRGNNQIRVVAMGARGPLAERSVEVQYVPPPPSSVIKITRPADGTVFGAPAQEVIEVEGEVFDPGIRHARVIFNEFAIPVTVKDGRFSALIPAIAPEMTIWADARGDRGSHSSDPVTVRREPYKAVRAYVLLYLPTASRKIDARLWLSQRASAADRDSARKITSHFPYGATASEQASILFAIPAMQDGAYTLALDYRIPSGESVEKGWCSVIVPGTTGYRNLRLGPFRLTGKGRVVLAKFLRPFGIFWDEDYWFTAVAEGAGSFTKFRHTDGVSWVELKGEPEFPAAK